MTWQPRLTEAGWRAISAPRSVALVGASGRTSSVSFTSRFLRTNADLGYRGAIHLINPHRTEIEGHRCWPSLDALPDAPDIVAINLPDEKVLPAVEAAIARGARALMIHSGGFGERGAAGEHRQVRLQALCHAAGIPALGPNCLGFLSFTNRVSVSSFKVSGAAPAGSIAAVSQSGSVASLLQKLAGRHGLSFLASTGNEAVTGSEDLIAHAIDDPATRMVVAFVEALRTPADLFPLAARAHAAGKPIVVLKAGLTPAGGEVSRGHTGALAGVGEVYRQAFRQAGVVLAEDFDELAQTVELFAAWTPRARPASLRVGMLGTSGGELGTVTDLAAATGVELPALAQGTKAALQTALALPADLWPRNPVDVGTGFNVRASYKERMRGAIRAVAADPEVDVIAVSQGFHRDSPDLLMSLNAEIMAAAAAEADGPKPVLVMSPRAAAPDDEVMAPVRAAGLPALEGARPALLAIRNLARYLAVTPRSVPDPISLPPLPAVLAGGVAAQSELFPFLAGLGLPMPEVHRVTSGAEAEAAVRGLPGLAAMKIDTGRVLHKSDVGGVALDVAASDAAERFQSLRACLDPPVGALEGEGVVVMPRIEDGTEFYVGAKLDAQFGAVVVCGLGGRLLEVLERTALLVWPFGLADALDAIERSGAARVLRGFRGAPPADLGALAALIVRVGQIAAALGPRLQVLDLNPVIVTRAEPGGIVADARLLLEPPP